MEGEKEDRVSSLPDCLLLEIISRIKIKNTYDENESELTTNEVIRTTATIAKRWQYLWTQLPNLEIHYYGRGLTYIDKTLTQCPTKVKLNKFTLSVSTTYYPTSHVYSLIRHAINRDVQEIDLLIYAYNSEVFSYDDELFFNNSCFMSMNIRHCVFNPPNSAIRWDNLKCLRISHGKLVDDSIGKILSGSPCLETLKLKKCYGVGRIDATSKRFKNLELTEYGFRYLHYLGEYYINTIEINAPYMLSLTINGNLYLEKLLLLNVSSLVKVDLCYRVSYKFTKQLGRTLYDIEEEMLSGVLSSLGHVNEIILGSTCSEVLTCLKAKGFAFSRDVTSRDYYY